MTVPAVRLVMVGWSWKVSQSRESLSWVLSLWLESWSSNLATVGKGPRSPTEGCHDSSVLDRWWQT